jgi:hypothetical protein
MRVLRRLIVFLALGPGLFMTFDGSRALILGDYLTPQSGRFAGQLGPWSDVVNAVGIAPRSASMKVIFVVLGVAWLAAVTAFERRKQWSAGILAVLAVLTLWYLPFGTVISALVLVGLALLGWRSNRPLQPTSDVQM